MRNKHILLMSSIFTVWIAFAASAAMVNTVKASPTTVAVDPPEYTAPTVGHTFNMSVKITDVTNLWSWGLSFSWDPEVIHVIVDAANNPLTYEGPFLKKAGPTLYLVSAVQDQGYIELASSTLFVQAGASGSGVLMTITFISVAQGTTSLDLEGTDLVDPDETPISHEVEGGLITVVPEFPAFIILPLFLIATTAIAIIAKIAWPRNTRRYPNTP